jgi:hypothetical protein
MHRKSIALFRIPFAFPILAPLRPYLKNFPVCRFTQKREASKETLFFPRAFCAFSWLCLFRIRWTFIAQDC